MDTEGKKRYCIVETKCCAASTSTIFPKSTRAYICTLFGQDLGTVDTYWQPQSVDIKLLALDSHNATAAIRDIVGVAFQHTPSIRLDISRISVILESGSVARSRQPGINIISRLLLFAYCAVFDERESSPYDLRLVCCYPRTSPIGPLFGGISETLTKQYLKFDRKSMSCARHDSCVSRQRPGTFKP